MAYSWLSNFHHKGTDAIRLHYGDGGYEGPSGHYRDSFTGMMHDNCYRRKFYGFKIVKRTGCTYIEIYDKKNKMIGEIFLPRGFKYHMAGVGTHQWKTISKPDRDGLPKYLYEIGSNGEATLFGLNHEIVGFIHRYSFYETRADIAMDNLLRSA